jgi:hypothetical protein
MIINIKNDFYINNHYIIKYMAERGRPLSIMERNITKDEIGIEKMKKNNVKIMIITAKENTYDEFIDSILTRRGWYGKTLSSIMMIFIDNYPICCYNNLNRHHNINETKEGHQLWNFLASIDNFRRCFRNIFYDNTTNFDETYISYCKFISKIINEKDFGEEIGYGTISRIRDGHGTCEYTGFGFLKNKWFTFDMMASASRIIYNDDYFNHHGSSTSVTLYDYIQYSLNTEQHISVDINLTDRMNIWYNLYDAKIKDKINTIIKKGELLNYRNFKIESEPESEPEPEPEPEQNIPEEYFKLETQQIVYSIMSPTGDIKIFNYVNDNYIGKKIGDYLELDGQEKIKLVSCEKPKYKTLKEAREAHGVPSLGEACYEELERELSSIMKPKYSIGENVTIIGSPYIKCVVESIHENEEFNYTYSLIVSNYKTCDGPINMKEIEKLPWTPENMIEKSS